ncbi:hypothetical protein L0P88_21840 [Muricauda sp. SCSIO 64092]|uniref:hypothetical protein n=1 Tax=Allomuricauda sp. SCSIO 64092 TaxID=2908842 RepID=UPI001FF4CBEC|nr:hypothetical protein [Muricauda sp. SCSIO 64092]UOY06552.1 hypothetical protein L0P88_21840 [Muricauda sp. SCSIO 64092]
MRKNGGWETGYSLLTSKTSKAIYFYLEGTYTSLDGLKSYSINDLYEYNQENNKVTMPLNELKSEILGIISKMSKN